MSDAELLERFLARRDDSAFEALLERHGPMVLGVCRQLVHDEHDADDAFQASFLMLVRKAESLRHHGTVGGWLFRVSYRVALRARASSARRRARETRVARPPAETSADDTLHPADRDLLYNEVQRLPEKYRLPVVLCYFEGCTHEEAARRLEWPVGTVRGRLARARDVLRSRLARRGLALSAGALATGWPLETEALCESLKTATVRAAALVATGGASGLSAPVMTLVKGELMTMARTRLRRLTITLLTVGAVAGGLALVGAGLPEAPPRAAPENGRPGSGDDAGDLADADLDRVVDGQILKRLPVEKDCMVLSYIPGWDHGDVDNLAVADNDGGVRTLVRWGKVAAGDAVSPDRRFLLVVYARRTTEGTRPGPVQAFVIEGDWPEKTSWKCQPPTADRPAAVFPFTAGEGWKLFDVSPIVRAGANGGPETRGVLLRFAGEDRPANDWSGYAFVSRESMSRDLRPVLLVVGPARATGRPGETARPRSSQPALDQPLLDRVDGRVAKALPVKKDLMVLSYLPQWNRGDLDNLAVADNGGGVRTLVSWGALPQEDLAPRDRKFLLALYSRETTVGSRPGTLQAHPLRAGWSEHASWETHPPFAREAGAEFSLTRGKGWKVFDLTPIIRSGSGANGVVLRFAVEDRPSNDWSGYAFVSREGEFPQLRPVLLLVDPVKQ
jgi:RNA polymerase sigma factor (sigma-70 family)